MSRSRKAAVSQTENTTAVNANQSDTMVIPDFGTKSHYCDSSPETHCSERGCEGRPVAYGFCVWHRPPCDKCGIQRFWFHESLQEWLCATCDHPVQHGVDSDSPVYVGRSIAEEALNAKISVYLDAKYGPEATAESINELLELITTAEAEVDRRINALDRQQKGGAI